MRLILIALIAATLGACATKPAVPVEGADLTLRPEQAVADIDEVRGHKVVWGGVIVAVANQPERTRIEVLGYPVDPHSARPLTDSPAQGRFVVHRDGYLETVDYAPGRIISVAGTLSDVEQGKVGDADYSYPVVAAEDLHLWRRGGTRSNTFFSIGLGIRISN